MTIHQGMRGSDVHRLQAALNFLGTPGNALVEDGIFGPKTLARVIGFQKQFNLVPDGKVGPITAQAMVIATLGALLSPGEGLPQL